MMSGRVCQQAFRAFALFLFLFFLCLIDEQTTALSAAVPALVDAQHRPLTRRASASPSSDAYMMVESSSLVDLDTAAISSSARARAKAANETSSATSSSEEPASSSSSTPSTSSTPTSTTTASPPVTIPDDIKALFPSEPPIPLRGASHPPDAPTLGGGDRTAALSYVHLWRDGYSWSGRDNQIFNMNGERIFHTQGIEWDSRRHTNISIVSGAQETLLAQFSSPWSAGLLKAWEVTSLDPVCANQEAYEEYDSKKMYSFARIKRHLGPYYKFSVQRYHCNGTLTPLWDVNSRYNVQVYLHLDISESSSGDLIGTIDLANWTNSSWYTYPYGHLDAWLSSGRDYNLFVALVAAVETTQNIGSSDSVR